MTRLTWGGNLRADREAQMAYDRLKPKPKKVRPKAKTKAERKAAKLLRKQRKLARKQRRPEPVNRKDFRTYAEYLASPWWKWRRRRTMRLAGYHCQRCGTAARLQVHHKNYARVGNEADEDLEALCEPCHVAEHPEHQPSSQ